MRRIVLIGGAAAAMVAAGCSDSSPTRAPTQWSGAVITVAAQNPNAHGELRGVVMDSAGALDPSQQIPLPGVTVELYLRSVVQGPDTTTLITDKVGQAVTDANGRFLVTAIPDGDYLITATPPANEPYFSGATLAFVSSGGAQRDATIYLPRKP